MRASVVVVCFLAIASNDCARSSTTEAPPARTVEAPATSAAHTKSVVEMFADDATLIVRGTFHLDATHGASRDDPSTGTITVRETLKGTCPPLIRFESSQPITQLTEHEAILILNESDRADVWRLELTGPGYAGLSVTESDAVKAAVERASDAGP